MMEVLKKARVQLNNAKHNVIILNTEIYRQYSTHTNTVFLLVLDNYLHARNFNSNQSMTCSIIKSAVFKTCRKSGSDVIFYLRKLALP